MTVLTEREPVLQPEGLNLREVDTYIFDYGGVVSFHYCEPWQGNLARLLSTTPEQARALLSETSEQGKAYRLGEMTRDDFWGQVKALAGSSTADPSELESNWAQSYQIDPRMLDLIQRLRSEKGFQVGVMMNTDKYRHEHIEKKYGLSQLVDFIISSYVHKVTKPDLNAYLAALTVANRLDTPGRTIYVDDRERNIIPGISIGMKGYQFTNFEDFMQRLEDENIL